MAFIINESYYQIELIFIAHQISRFFLLDWVQLFKTLFLNWNFLLHMTKYLTKPVTELSFVYSCWISLLAQSHSDQLTFLKAPPFYKDYKV